MDNLFNIGNNKFQIMESAVFQSLDAKDGNNDGKISASIWNEFADKVGGKHINNFITKQNALRSISTYLKRGGEIVKQAIYDYFGWSTDKAHERLNEADKMMEDISNNPSIAKITKKTLKSGKRIKTATLPDGRFIDAYYDKNGKIANIYVSTDVVENTYVMPNKKYRGDNSEVSYSKDGAWVEAETSQQKNCRFDLNVTDGYDFEKYKQMAEKIFGSEFDD